MYPYSIVIPAYLWLWDAYDSSLFMGWTGGEFSNRFSNSVAALGPTSLTAPR